MNATSADIQGDPASADGLQAVGERALRIDTSLTRSVAVLAIVNSHMETYYPRPELALGGLVGLALFFMATGIGLNASRATRTLAFLPWYWRRIIRIHPSVIVSAVLVQLLLFGEWKHWTAWNYVDNLIYPMSGYQFLTKIFIYYVPLYYYVRWASPRKHWCGIGGCILLCCITAWPDILKLHGSDQPLATGQLNQAFLWSVFFLTAMIGVWLSDSPWLFQPRSPVGLLAAVLAAGVAYLTTKYAMAKAGRFTEGFLMLYATGILLSMLLVILLADPRLIARCRRSSRPLAWATIGLGTISLEVYLVHTRVYANHIGNQFAFPFNVIVFAAASIGLASVVYWLAARIRDELLARISGKR